MNREQSNAEPRSHERQRVEKSHLPRLAPEFYRGLAVVHWTLTIEKRAIGWLTPTFHREWQLALLHTCSRYSLACPAYVLMPDHVHLVWLGLDRNGSDQRVALEFLRKQLRPHLAPATWQQQAYDHVLDERERAHEAFPATAHYIFENPVRKKLVGTWTEYPFTGCCVAGYPEFDVKTNDYWSRFWRCYNYLIEKRR